MGLGNPTWTRGSLFYLFGHGDCVFVFGEKENIGESAACVASATPAKLFVLISN